MKIVAREYYRKWSLIPFISWGVDSAATFGDHRVEFDLSEGQVVRVMDDDPGIIARIQPGWKGTRISEFFGTVESDEFAVTKRKQDGMMARLSRHVIFEITLKHGGLSVENVVMPCDLFTPFVVGDILRLKLSQDDAPGQYSNLMVDGTCAEAHQDLAEVLATLLLHHNERSGPS